MRSDDERLQDRLEAIERIKRYAVQGRATFDQNELIQTWIVHHLQVMRTFLVHRYSGIDANVVWSVVENDLPGIEAAVRKIVDNA